MAELFYKTRRWMSKRLKILRRDEYLCQECKRFGKTTQAQTVHHIIPLSWCILFDSVMSLANNNLVSLCDRCHDKMHNRTNRKLTESGLSWVKRMGEIGIVWIKKYAGEW